MVTVTGNVQKSSFPPLSEKVYLTTVVPIENTDPGELVLSISVTVPEKSVAVGSVQKATPPVDPNSITTEIGAGQLAMTGGWVSTVREKIKIIQSWERFERCTL